MTSQTRSVRSSVLEGAVSAPASKSHMQRVVAASLLSSGSTRIENPSDCDDARAALGVAAALGATVERTGDALVVTGGLRPRPAAVDCGESGLCLRMFIPIAALAPAPVTLRARGSLSQRPVGMAEPTLRQLGAECASENGFPPVRVRGPLRGGRADVDGSVSSQFLTGLLLALPCAGSDTTLIVSELKSRPYIDLTLETLAAFGVRVEHDDYRIFSIPGCPVCGINLNVKNCTCKSDKVGRFTPKSITTHAPHGKKIKKGKPK